MTISKDKSNLIKGVAILLMMIHHFWNPLLQPISERIDFFSYSISNPEIIVGIFCKVCVSIFAFLTGWVFALRKEKFSSYKYIAKKIITFLLDYWIVAFIFLLLGAIFNLQLPHTWTFVENLFGFEVGVYEIMGYNYTNVTMAWYVRFYLLLLVSFPLLSKFLDRLVYPGKLFRIVMLLFAIALLRIKCCLSDNYLINKLFGVYFEWLPSVIWGYYCCHYNLLDKLFVKIKLIYALFLVPAMIIARHYIYLPQSVNIDYLYAAIICILIMKFNISFITRALTYLGSISMFLWFVHSIFFIPSRPFSGLITFANNDVVLLLGGAFFSIIFTLCIIYIKNVIFLHFKIANGKY